MSLEPLEEAKRKRAGDDGNGKGGTRSLLGLVVRSPFRTVASYYFKWEPLRKEVKIGTKSIFVSSRITKHTFFSY